LGIQRRVSENAFDGVKRKKIEKLGKNSNCCKSSEKIEIFILGT
jgi:hypothetical protein